MTIINSKKRKQQSIKLPKLVMVVGLFCLAGYTGFKYFFKPQSVAINEVTSGGVGQGSVPSVTISGRTYAYGYGNGNNGGTSIAMEGVTQGLVFYPWGYSGNGAPNFNPSASVQFATANGQYTSTGGGAPILHNPPLVFTAPPNPTPYPSWDPNAGGNTTIKRWPAKATDPNHTLCPAVRYQPMNANQFKQSHKLSSTDLYMKCFNFDFDGNGRIEFLGDVEYFRRSIYGVVDYIAKGNKWPAKPTDPSNAVCKNILTSFTNPKLSANPLDLMKCFDYDFDQNGKINDQDRRSLEWLWQFVSSYQR